VQGTDAFLKAMGVSDPTCFGFQQLTYLQYPTGTYVIPMIASSYTLAATICCLIVSIIGMPLGRRNIILLGNAFVVVGAVIQASSWSVGQIIAGRILCGFGIGFISCTVPTYMAEMSSSQPQQAQASHSSIKSRCSMHWKKIARREQCTSSQPRL
jgi:MFS family permease